jgi:hypothetical protein
MRKSFLVKFKTPSNLTDYTVTDSYELVQDTRNKFPQAEISLVGDFEMPYIATLTKVYDKASKGIRLENHIPKIYGISEYRSKNENR